MYKLFHFWKIKSLEKQKRKVILVTGCSSGIGLAIIDLLYNLNSFKLVATTREKSIGILQNRFAENENFIILPLDVNSSESRKKLIESVYEKWKQIDIIINNAGICYRSVIEEMSEKDEELQMTTNYLGPISLIRSVLPKMRKQGSGKIINISSVGGLLAMPTMGSYSASKFALEGAMEALWYETRPFGINVSLVQPGFVKSSSYEKVKFSIRSQLSVNSDRTYSNFYKEMIPFIEKFMKWGLVTPDDIAQLVLDVIKTTSPPLWIPASFDAEFFYYLKRWFPRRLLMPFLYWILPNSKNWVKTKNLSNETTVQKTYEEIA